MARLPEVLDLKPHFHVAAVVKAVDGVSFAMMPHAGPDRGERVRPERHGALPHAHRAPAGPHRRRRNASAYGRLERGPGGPRTARRGVAPHPRPRDRLGSRSRPPIMPPATSPQNGPWRARRPGEMPAVRAVFQVGGTAISAVQRSRCAAESNCPTRRRSIAYAGKARRAKHLPSNRAP